MLVELDIFSGRPNPRWELDEQSSRQLLQLRDRLTSTKSAPPEPPGLGYRGFVYLHGGREVRVYCGYMKTPTEVVADPTFSIEQFLLAHLPPEYAAVRSKTIAECHRRQ